jgi:hypothetical protein
MKKPLFLLVILTFLSNGLSAQHLIRVNNNPDFDAAYTTLQAAVSNASSGDTIYMEGSATEYAGATINKKLTIIGPGFFLPENPKTQANHMEAIFNTNVTFSTGAAGSAMMGCRFQYGTLMMINASNITVIRNYLSGVEFNTNSSNVVLAQNYVDYRIATNSGQLTNSIISNNIIQGQIDMGNSSGSLIISNNVFGYSSGYLSISCFNSTIQNNILSGIYTDIATNTGNAISNNILAIDGINENGNQYNIDMNSVFADFNGALGMSNDGKWQLMDGSPATGAGIGGKDCGAFAGQTPYILSGIPGLPHIYQADIPASATTESGLQVTIHVMSGE